MGGWGGWLLLFLDKEFFKQRSCNLKKIMSQHRDFRHKTLFASLLNQVLWPNLQARTNLFFYLDLWQSDFLTIFFFLNKKLLRRNLYKEYESNKVLFADLNIFSQLKKVQQAFPGATLTKLSQAWASFPAMPSTLPFCCFSTQIQRKILTKITNEISTCCKPGHEVVERNLVRSPSGNCFQKRNWIFIC